MGLALAGLAMSGIGTAASFIDAGKQKNIMAAAEADAQKSLDEAKKEIQKNAYKGLSVNKDPYNRERDALLSAGAQAIEAGKESNRGAAATAGRVQMAQVEGQAGIQASQSREEKQLDYLVANEDSRIKDALAQINLQTAQGSQLQARDAKFAQSKDMAGAFAGMGAMGKQLISMAPLYAKTPDNTETPSLASVGGTDNGVGIGGALNADGSLQGGDTSTMQDATDWSNLSPEELKVRMEKIYQQNPKLLADHLMKAGFSNGSYNY